MRPPGPRARRTARAAPDVTCRLFVRGQPIWWRRRCVSQLVAFADAAPAPGPKASILDRSCDSSRSEEASMHPFTRFRPVVCGVFVACVCLGAGTSQVAAQANPDPARFEKDIAAFEA